LDIEQFGDLFGLADLEGVIVDLIDLVESPDLHQDKGIMSIFVLKMALQVKVDLSEELLFLLEYLCRFFH
jgi:hypothetical protein